MRLEKHPRAILTVYLLLLAIALPGAFQLRLDNAPERFFVQDAQALERYRRFEMDFGRDRALRLVVKGEGLWTGEGLQWLADLEEEAMALPEVLAAGGPARHNRARWSRWMESPPTVAAELRNNPVDRNAGWVSRDGSVVTVMVVLYRLPPEVERRTLTHLQELLRKAPPGVEGSLVGLPVVQRAIDQKLLRLFRTTFPWLGLATVVFLLLLFRRPRDAARPLLLVAVVEGTLLGLLGWTEAVVDLVTILLIPLVFVITLATAVHLEMRFLVERQRAPKKPRQAAVATLRRKAWPVLWTGVTTAVGFGSLAVAPVPAVQNLGAWCFVGFLWMTLAALHFYPALLVVTGCGRATRNLRTLAAWGRRRAAPLATATTATRGRRGWTVAVYGLVALVALVGVPRLPPSAGLPTYLPEDHPLRRESEILQGAGIGTAAAEVVVTSPVLPFDSDAGLVRLATLAAEVRKEPMLLGVLGAGDLVEEARRSGGALLSPTAALERLRDREPLPLLNFFLNLDSSAGPRARITLFLPMEDSATLEPVFQRAQAAARRAFPGAEVELTGRYPLVLSARATLLRTLIRSLGITLLVIAVIFRGILGNTGLALRALAPNIWPVLVILGGMGWGKVSLDSTTVMVAAAGLGLAVDDTLHTLGSFRRADAVGLDRAAAARRALRELLPAHALTSALLVGGFGICALADFPPVSRFAALTMGAVAAALVADGGLAPALLARPDRGRPGGAAKLAEDPLPVQEKQSDRQQQTGQ